MSQAHASADVPIKRIRDLLRRSRNRIGAVDHEADRASERATELLQRYGLSEQDLKEEAVEISRLSPGLQGNQRVELARQVARSRNCRTTVKREGIAFTGVPEAAKDASQLFTALVRVVEQHAELPSHSGVYRSPNDQLAWRTCFWLGFVAAVQKQLDPEHATIPEQALAKIMQATPPPFLSNLANGMLAEHGSKEADQLRKLAYAEGLRTGELLSLQPYRGPK